MAQPLRAPVVPLSSGSERSPSHEIAPASAPTVGLRGRVCRPSVVSGGSVRPRLVVRRQSSPLWTSSSGPTPWIRAGGEPLRSVRFGPVVSGGGPPLHQPQGVACDSPGIAPLRSFVEESHRGGLCGQHHGFCAPVSPRGNVFTCHQPGGSAPPPLGRVPPDSPCPPFIMGSRNVVADSLSLQDQTFGSEWTLAQEVVSDLQRCWPVTIDLLPTAHNYCLPVYFSPLNDPMVAGTDAFLQSLDHLQAYAFSPFSLICQVLSKLQSSWSTLPDAYSSSLASERVVSGPSASVGGSSYRPTFTSQSAQTTTCPSSAPEPPHATASCVETVERFARHLGLFHRVARQLSLCRRPSSRKLYQHHWEVYRRWCAGRGYSVSSLSIAKVTDFLLFLRKERHLSVPSIRGFWAALSSVFKFVLPEIRENFILWDLIRSFELERPLSPVVPPSWDLVRVFSFLRGSSFEPLSSCSLHQLMMKVLFLLSLVTAKRVGKLQALSRCVIFCGPDLSLSYLPEFVAKTEAVHNPLSRSFLVKSLEDFMGAMPEERSLCPVRALHVYLNCTSSLSPRLRFLFVCPSNPLRPLSKNALSFFLRSVI